MHPRTHDTATLLRATAKVSNVRLGLLPDAGCDHFTTLARIQDSLDEAYPNTWPFSTRGPELDRRHLLPILDHVVRLADCGGILNIDLSGTQSQYEAIDQRQQLGTTRMCSGKVGRSSHDNAIGHLHWFR
jgi:hypothetical protein